MNPRSSWCVAAAVPGDLRGSESSGGGGRVRGRRAMEPERDEVGPTKAGRHRRPWLLGFLLQFT